MYKPTLPAAPPSAEPEEPVYDLHNNSLECPPDLAASLPEDCQQCYIEKWHQIQSGQRGGQLIKVYTQRRKKDKDIGDMLHAIFCDQSSAFKISISFGFILSNVETGEKRYYYPSQNGFIFDQPLVVADEEDLQRVGEVD